MAGTAGVAVVTGGAGFIGRHVVHELRARGFRVVVYDARTRAATSWEHLAHLLEPGDLVLGDVLNEAMFHGVLHKVSPDVVYHLAAESHVDASLRDAAHAMRVNGEGTMKVAQASAWSGVPLLYVSTDEVYGDTFGHKRAMEAHDGLAPSSPYSAGKAAGEHAVHACGRSFGLRYAIVRPSNAWGEHQLSEKLVPRLAFAAYHGGSVELHDNGEQTRQWVNVNELADGIVRAGERLRAGTLPASSTTINLGGPLITSVRMLAASFSDVARRPMTRNAGNVSRPGQDMGYWIDTVQAREVIGWEARRCLTDEAELHALVEHYGQDAGSTPTDAVTPVEQDAGRASGGWSDVVECVAIERRPRRGPSAREGLPASP
jgi:dTDP-glucose 4,6-dehydratase